MVDVNMEIGAQPELAWVDVDLIDVDNNYQREVDGRRVNKILKKFKWDHFGAVALVPADNGRFFVTDGQHRVKAALLHPNVTKVPATIVQANELKDAAGNFLAINRDRKAVTTVEKYWAGIAAEDPECKRIEAALADAGCDVVPEHGYTRPNLTHSVTTVRKAISRDGHESVVAALLAIRQARPNDATALKATLIGAVSQVLGENPQADKSRLAAVLAPSRDTERVSAADAHKQLNNSSAQRAHAGAIVAMYNKGLSKNQLVEPEKRQ